MNEETRAIKAEDPSAAPPEDPVAELEKDVEVMNLLMSNCTDDEAYRIYQRRLDEFHRRLHEARQARDAAGQPARRITREGE